MVSKVPFSIRLSVHHRDKLDCAVVTTQDFSGLKQHLFLPHAACLSWVSRGALLIIGPQGSDWHCSHPLECFWFLARGKRMLWRVLQMQLNAQPGSGTFYFYSSLTG